MTMFLRSCVPTLAVVMIAGGCSKGVSLKTVPVSGKVTLNNQPVAGATVLFQAEAPAGQTAPPAPATGVTGADGSYNLSTMASGAQVVDGAPPGIYKVTITKSTAAGGMTGPMADMSMSEEDRVKKMQSMSPEEMAKMAGTAAQPEAESTAKSEIPARYSNLDESGLTATVASSGPQTFDFPLTSE